MTSPASVEPPRLLTLLYRGPLQSCNYGCGYCPFAHQAHTLAELEQDRAALLRFTGWVAGQRRALRVFFTPGGEALVHPAYQEALCQLSQLPQVVRVAIQTNLSGGLDWLPRCRPERVGIWASYHPAFVSRARFLERCRELTGAGVRFSVGMVGLPEQLAELEAMRRALPEEVYLWVNAEKRHPASRDPGFVARVEAVDPLFRLNLRPHPSRGLPCQAGETLLSVDGAGDLRRCHFLPGRLGNLYRDPLGEVLRARPCPAETCRCHIGYVHLRPLGLHTIFGDGILERAPAVSFRALALPP